MGTALQVGKLFRVKLHTSKLAEPDIVHDGNVVEPGIPFGYCGNGVDPTAGEGVCFCDSYSLVLATEEDCDDDGNLLLSDNLDKNDVTVEAVESELGWWDADGTMTIVLAYQGSDRFSDVYAVTL